jgi:hypothetical protein
LYCFDGFSHAKAYMSGQKDLLVQLVRQEKNAKDDQLYEAYCTAVFNEIGAFSSPQCCAFD